MEREQRSLRIAGCRKKTGAGGTKHSNQSPNPPTPNQFMKKMKPLRTTIMDSMMYEPESREYLTGEMWAYGFMTGVNLCREDWQPLLDDPDANELIRPIYLLGAEEVTEEEESLTRWPAQREELSKLVAASVAAIYLYWLPHREVVRDEHVATFRREGPKLGRNDPCPCGSGMKFKKCCGAAPTLQ